MPRAGMQATRGGRARSSAGRSGSFGFHRPSSHRPGKGGDGGPPPPAPARARTEPHGRGV